jgi:hypothetical protein
MLLLGMVCLLQKYQVCFVFLWGNLLDIFDAAKTFIEVNTISTKINSLWEHFSNMCQEHIDEHVPSKMK